MPGATPTMSDVAWRTGKHQALKAHQDRMGTPRTLNLFQDEDGTDCLVHASKENGTRSVVL